MNNVGLKEESRVHYATALRPKYSQQPIVRRKHSGSTRDFGSLHNSFLHKSNHLRTDSNGNWHGDENRHPLTLNQAGPLDTSGVTRPRLSRTLGMISKESRDHSELEADEPSFCEEEVEVIVHEVTPTDSLAGVSLKYGITLADLRRANHLWASDSIHLREVLYIPLERSLKARDLIQDMKVKTTPLVDLSTLQGSAVAAESSNSPSSPGLGVLRVPTSRMSFFPPPATSGKTPSMSSALLPPLGSNVKPPSHARHLTSPSLVSILTALPIFSSTRDDLIARLSFDSASSNVSERSRPSLDHSEGHELDVVVNHEQMASQLSQITHRPKFTSKTIDPNILQSMAGSEPPAVHPIQARDTRHLSTSPPAMYISRIPDSTSIRTVQMEPSPIMQLPTLRSRKSQLPPNTGISIYTQRRPQDDLIELN
ncbi:hypothetical protein Ac2012v2_004601 [Leucoagaricus gongylophorus]